MMKPYIGACRPGCQAASDKIRLAKPAAKPDHHATGVNQTETQICRDCLWLPTACAFEQWRYEDTGPKRIAVHP